TLAHYEPFDIAEPSRDKFFISSLPITYDFNGFSVTSVSGFWSRRSLQKQDGTEQMQTLFGTPSFDPALGGTGPVQVYETDYSRQFSQELRVASTGSGPLKWLGGAFYSQYYTRYLIGVASAPEAASVFGSSDLVTGVIATDIKQNAVFGNLTYEITPKLKAEAGLRYFRYEDSNILTTSGVVYGAVPPAPPQVSVAGGSNSGINPMFNVSYSPGPNSMIYATASKGFREGGGNYYIPTSDASPIGPGCLADLQAIGLNSAPLQYGPDSVWNYELGEKSQFFKNRLQVNADAYYIRWSRVQSFVLLGAPESCNMYFTDNGADATVKGGELEFKALLGAHLELSQNVGYAYAAYSSSDPAAGIVEGQKLYDVPQWTVSTSLRYERPIGRVNFVAMVENSFQSNLQELTYQVFTLPSRDLVNVRVGLTTPAWSAFIFVDNALDRHFPLEYVNLITQTGPDYSRIATNQPLTAGVDLSYNF
ncbi:MAG TPA: TonB-dependent receptor, partial [Nitrospira sp.]|nr:TonB-dependent receptor [Nitrospira sp.]